MVSSAVHVLSKMLTLLLLAGASLMLIFIVLSGTVDHFPINHFFWLRADTQGIEGAPADVTAWTFWGVCRLAGSITQCSNLGPAVPLSPVDNFPEATNLADTFFNNRDTYYFLSRFSFAFYLIGLAFNGISFIMAFFTVCSYGASKIVFGFVTVGGVAIMAATAFETAVTVMVKNAFKKSGMPARLGHEMYGIAWATVACMVLLFFLTGGSFLRQAYHHHKGKMQEMKEREQQSQYAAQQPFASQPVDAPQQRYNDPYDEEVTAQEEHKPNSGIKFFKIRRDHNKDAV